MKQRKGVTQSRLAELFDYKDGVLFRKVTRGNSKAGTPYKNSHNTRILQSVGRWVQILRTSSCMGADDRQLAG